MKSLLDTVEPDAWEEFNRQWKTEITPSDKARMLRNVSTTELRRMVEGNQL